MQLLKKLFLSLAAFVARITPAGVKRRLYHSGPLARMIRQSLNRAAPQGLTVVSVAGGALAGMRLELDLHSEKDYWLGTYEQELQAAVTDLVPPGAVAYDVGANIGYISLLLARASGPSGCVFAFEALPGNVARLRQNIRLNDLDARISVFSGAVIDAQRPVRFLIGPSGGMGKAEGSAGRQQIAYEQALEVPGISLDEFVFGRGNPLPQVIKMDIEGGEVLALPGMRRCLAEAHPVLLMELHGPESAQVAWETLTNAGYRLCHMEPGFPQAPGQAEMDWKAYLVALPPDAGQGEIA